MRARAHTPGDGAVDVRDDDPVVPAPQVDGALASAGALVLGGHTEHHIVRTVLQLEGHLTTEDRTGEGRKGDGGQDEDKVHL